jgi:L-ascorbate metabolism protein UlaG (beta-lactamase superfamily)
VEESDARILLDPGSYSTAQNEVRDVDAILVTQEHGDHLDVNSIKTILKSNPRAKIFTNRGSGKVLEKDGIPFELLEDGQNATIKEVLVEACGREHATIYPTLPPVDNTGYFIAERFFYPGDALVNPGKKVEILALPVAGPWLKLSEAIDYAREIKPEICFPVHDGILKSPGMAHRIPAQILEPLGIKFVILEESKERKFLRKNW